LPAGRTEYIDADIRDPEEILGDPGLRETLDLTQPVALMLAAVLHFLSETDDPYRVVATLLDALPSGSLLVLSHASYDLLPEDTARRLTHDDYLGKEGFFARTRAEVNGFFAGLELLGEPVPEDGSSPRIGLISEWCRGPEDGQTPPGSAVSTWGGMGRKP